MIQVTLTDQYQIRIPDEVRSTLHLEAGQKLSLELKGNSISLIPEKNVHSYRGILKGADISDFRDHSERP